jgi:GTP-binding protein SAR1
LFLGLDNAGKTTLLRLLREDKVIQHEPTQLPQYEELVIGNIHFQAHDLGGHRAARRVWNQFFHAVDGIVFLVDVADTKRLEESKEELSNLLASPELARIPFVVLGNKIDKPGAVSEEQLKSILGITRTSGKGPPPASRDNQPIEVFMCSVVKRAGYADGFRWLSNYL